MTSMPSALEAETRGQLLLKAAEAIFLRRNTAFGCRLSDYEREDATYQGAHRLLRQAHDWSAAAASAPLHEANRRV
jgi:hypothetical protein